MNDTFMKEKPILPLLTSMALTMVISMSVSPVTGYWRPLDGCNPYIGTNGEISCEPELKVEVTVSTENVDKTIEAVKTVHPYEEPVINVIPLWRTSF